MLSATLAATRRLYAALVAMLVVHCSQELPRHKSSPVPRAPALSTLARDGSSKSPLVSVPLAFFFQFYSHEKLSSCGTRQGLFPQPYPILAPVPTSFSVAHMKPCSLRKSLPPALPISVARKPPPPSFPSTHSPLCLRSLSNPL